MHRPKLGFENPRLHVLGTVSLDIRAMRSRAKTASDAIVGLAEGQRAVSPAKHAADADHQLVSQAHQVESANWVHVERHIYRLARFPELGWLAQPESPRLARRATFVSLSTVMSDWNLPCAGDVSARLVTRQGCYWPNSGAIARAVSVVGPSFHASRPSFPHSSLNWLTTIRSLVASG